MRESVPAADALLDRYFPVLDHGFVALKDYMGGDRTVERFARTSYKIDDEERTLKQTRDLIRYLLRHRHTSPFESTELTFHVGLPIFVARQLIRHRTANLNEFSGRYSEMPTIFYMPDNSQICKQSTSNKQGRDDGLEKYTRVDFQHKLERGRDESVETYKWALEQGVARETARIDLPLSTYTYMYWKMDLHNLMHYVGLRSDPHAQWEIRQYSDVFAGLMKAVAPLCFEAFEDYKFGAVTFSRMEHAVLSRLVRENPEELRAMLAEQGVDGEREQGEFLAKIERKARKSFDLDLDSARDADFFFDKVKANL